MGDEEGKDEPERGPGQENHDSSPRDDAFDRSDPKGTKWGREEAAKAAEDRARSAFDKIYVEAEQEAKDNLESMLGVEESEGAEKEPVSKDKTKPTKQSEREKHRKLLEVDGFTEEFLEKLPDAVLAKQATARLAQIKQLEDDRKELTRFRTAAKNSNGETKSEESRQSATASQADDFSGIVKEFEAEFGSEGAKVFSRALEGIKQSNAERMKKIEDRLDGIGGQVERNELGSARENLSQRIPELAREDVWGKVVERATEIANPKRHASMEDALEEAAKGILLSFGERDELTSAELRAREQGQLIPPKRAGRPKQTAAPGELSESRQKDIFNAIMDEDIDRARRIRAHR